MAAPFVDVSVYLLLSVLVIRATGVAATGEEERAIDTLFGQGLGAEKRLEDASRRHTDKRGWNDGATFTYDDIVRELLRRSERLFLPKTEHSRSWPRAVRRQSYFDNLGGSNLMGKRTFDSLGGSNLMRKRTFDNLGGSNLIGKRTFDSLGGSNLMRKRTFDNLGGSNLIGKRTFDSLGGSNLMRKRTFDNLGGSNLIGKRPFDSLGGSNLMRKRTFDNLGGSNLIGKRTFDSLGGSNILGKRTFDSLGGSNIIGKRTFDSLGGSNLLDEDLKKKAQADAKSLTAFTRHKHSCSCQDTCPHRTSLFHGLRQSSLRTGRTILDIGPPKKQGFPDQREIQRYPSWDNHMGCEQQRVSPAVLVMRHEWSGNKGSAPLVPEEKALITKKEFPDMRHQHLQPHGGRTEIE
ncbi:PREDICTED: feeding circuit activating peptides-like [Priapulus caudatus]|uniref:Feeding circuit activating peptides-like n=1 Tax=Priapulus caudatus TaxID=37621 RepID=A0ABM1EJH3_PRICU|nr:PREDICTED: feeding circuit activating peptides-like [Priapulus caudatus]